jgi:hypothetical protein
MKDRIMTTNDILHYISILVLLIYGIPSAIWPRWVAKWLEIDLITGRGSTEFRVMHGGSMVGLSLFALYSRNPLVFQTLGWGLIGAAIIRLLAWYPDRPKLAISLVSFVFELMFGIFLLV